MSQISGFVAAGFEPVRDAFEQNFADDLELGAGFAAYMGDELIVDLRGGWADRRKTIAWDEHTLTPVFSTTKPIAALVVCMALFHKLNAPRPYDTQVAELWPEFAAHGKGDLTIGEMMSHQAGLPGFVDEIPNDLWFDPPALAARLADTAPMWTPGDGSGYHPLTWGYLTGELVRRLTGHSLGDLLRDHVTNCSGANPAEEVIDFWIGLPESEHARCAEIQRPTKAPDLGEINAFRRTAFLTKWAAPNRLDPRWRTAEIPSANGHGTAKSTARLYSAYANHGAIGARQLLPHANQYAQLTARQCAGDDRVLPFFMEFAAGVMRNNNRIYGPNPNTLAHAGWGGSFGLGDPDRELSAAYVMNRQSNALQTDIRAQNLIGALYGCM